MMHDVIIIGAGAAGLMTASTLRKAALDAVIIEARDRIGGRAWTLRRDEGETIELGAEFVHGRPQVTSDLLSRNDLTTTECTDLRLIREGDRLRAMPEFWEVINKVDRQIDPRRDIPYGQFLTSAQASPWESRIARLYAEGFNAASADLIGTAAIAQADRAANAIDGERQFRITGGYAALLDRVASELSAEQLRLGEVVREIDWGRGRVRVIADSSTGAREYDGRRLVITVPLGVLKAPEGEHGGMRFRPEPRQMAALRDLHMGHVSKIALRFRERFWSKHGRFGFALDDGAAFPTWWTQDPSVSHWLTGWAGGSPSQKLIGLPKQELVERAVSSLAKIFSISGKTLHELVDGVEHHDWSCDPYSRGAYSYQGVGGLEASRALAQQVDDTLWFAGEATDSFGHSGTVHAALASGLRAASEIIALT